MLKNTQIKIGQDDQDLIESFVSSPAWDSWGKVMRNTQLSFIKNVMSYNLKQGTEGLALEKAKADGVEAFITQLIAYRDKTLGKNPSQRR